MSGKAVLQAAKDEANRAHAELLNLELAKARRAEEKAWDAFFSALDGDDLTLIRRAMRGYLKAAEERADIEDSAGEASEEMERRAALHVRLTDRYKGLKAERFTIDR